MPIYEYRCDDCENVFEEWQKDFEDRDVPCPKCNGKSHRLISNTAFILKGSGWYVTDYARNGSSCSSNANGNGDTAKGADNGNGKSADSSAAGESKAAPAKSESSSSCASGGESKSASKDSGSKSTSAGTAAS